MRNLIKELEDFNNGHKARSVTIHIDDGYGASCWTVELHNEKKRTIVAEECSFFELEEPNGKIGDISYWNGKDNAIVVFVDKDLDKSWPGLEKTVSIALDAAKIFLNMPVSLSGR